MKEISAEKVFWKAVNEAYEEFGTPDFRSKAFRSDTFAPDHWRMVMSSAVLQGEVENGGLAQFLWNTFYHHNRILDDCSELYALVSAPLYVEAVMEYRLLCEKHANGCQQQIEKAGVTQDSSHFHDWYDSAESEMDSQKDSLFYSSGRLPAILGEWVRENDDFFASLD